MERQSAARQYQVVNACKISELVLVAVAQYWRTLFEKQEDYEAFECVLRVLKLTHEFGGLLIYAYCVMPNHCIRGSPAH